MFFLSYVSCFAQGEKAAIEIRADRILIYPQRLELTGEETLLDVLMMFPDLMQKGFDDMVGSYNLRLDNVAMNGNPRLLCSQLKANLVSKVQICDNTGVAKGTIGNGRVIDVNLLRMKEGVHGFVGGQYDSDNLLAPSAEVRYGGKSTDIYANASYTHAKEDGTTYNNQYLTFHMTNRFSSKDRLLTYFTQQYLHNRPSSGTDAKMVSRKFLGRARYFHSFNDKGTELLLLAGYQYNDNPTTTVLPDDRKLVVGTSQKTLMGMVELNTPLFTPALSLMVGWEGDWAYNTYKEELFVARTNDYMVSNNDLYVQLSYKTGMWRFTLGDRVMFFHYGVEGFMHDDTRNNVEASAIMTPDGKNQIQMAYHRKFSNPSYSVNGTMPEEEWIMRKGSLRASYIDEGKLGYAYAKKNFSLISSLAWLSMEDADNMLRLNVAGYLRKGVVSVNAGVNYYNIKGEGNDLATFFIAPKVSLPCRFQVAAKGIFFTDKSAAVRDQQIYAELQANKQLGRHWDVQLMWHDMFDKSYSAALAGVQYRF